MPDETEQFRADVELSANFRFLEKLGEGGTGMVFRASRINLPDQNIAVKVLTGPSRGHPPIWRATPTLLTALNHPRLVKVHSCGALGSVFYVEMEYIEGSSLRSAITPGIPWSLSDAGPVVLGLADALDYLHKRGLLHLDLKPENVLGDPRQGIKLADLDGVVPMSVGRLTWERGSPDYCAPEQRFGLAVDERADVFGLAAVTYELVTGRLSGRVYVPGTQRNPSLPSRLDEALRAGLSRDAHDRPTMAAFICLLRTAFSP